jgi:hypothetical protein
MTRRQQECRRQAAGRRSAPLRWSARRSLRICSCSGVRPPLASPWQQDWHGESRRRRRRAGPITLSAGDFRALELLGLNRGRPLSNLQELGAKSAAKLKTGAQHLNSCAGAGLENLSMRAFLVFLIFAGAVAYGFLAALHNLLPPVNPDVAASDQAARQTASGSWSSYLPDEFTLKQSTREWARPAMPSGSQITRYEEPAHATDTPVSQPFQPAVASAAARNTATEVVAGTPKAVSPKRKATVRRVKPAPTDATIQATDDPPSVKRPRRPFGFLFGRYAARE